MNKEFKDFITEFIEDVTAEYRRLARGTPRSDRYTLGIIQRRAAKIVAEHYSPRNYGEITV